MCNLLVNKIEVIKYNQEHVNYAIMLYLALDEIGNLSDVIQLRLEHLHLFLVGLGV